MLEISCLSLSLNCIVFIYFSLDFDFDVMFFKNKILKGLSKVKSGIFTLSLRNQLWFKYISTIATFQQDNISTGYGPKMK